MQTILAHLEKFRNQQRMHAGSLIMSVFGDAILPRGGRVWLGSLVHLLEPLGLNERLIRTAVFRLSKEEWLRTESVGRRSDYELTVTGLRRFEEASRHIYAAQASQWDRRWRVILTLGDFDVKTRDRLRRALFWQGFGAIGNDCFVHPSAELNVAFDALIADGLSDVLPRLMPLLAADTSLGASGNDLVRRAWNLEALSKGYSEFVAIYFPILTELRQQMQFQITPQDAFLIRTLLIQDYRRLLLRDPELPEVLLPADWSGQMARLVCRDLYRKLLSTSEKHLDEFIVLADGSKPSPNDLLTQRFPTDDPLNNVFQKS